MATGLFQVALEDGNVNGCSLILSLRVGTHTSLFIQS
jgi:hypothetical protein